MEEKKIIEGNTIIHDWIGARRMKPPFDKWWIGAQKPEDLRYHLSWNWLMPVVEKIEGLGYDSRICGHNSDGGYLCDFVNFENEEAASKTSYSSKIEAVWLSVIDFITWYNSSNQLP